MAIKKIFLCDFSSAILGEVALELQKRGGEIVYWTGCKSDFESFSKDKHNFSKTIFHNIADAVRGIPAPNFNISEFDPPGTDLIDKMLEYESIVLSMMTRMDYTNMPIAKKKALYYRYLQYWNGVLGLLKPDVIIFPEAPHAVYNFVLSGLAKMHGIPQIMFGPSRLSENYLLSDDYKKPSDDLADEYSRIKDERHELGELPLRWQDDFKNLLDNKLEAAPPYTIKRLKEIKKHIRLLPSLTTMANSIKSGNFFRHCYRHLASFFSNNEKIINNIDPDDNLNYKGILQLNRLKKIKKEFKNEYLEFLSEINLGDDREKFIFVPFHYQPEKTTCPLSGHFNDQILMVKILSAALPADWKIYVKENFLQWAEDDSRAHLGRYRGYYRELASLKNVKLVPTNISGLSLVSACEAVAVGTGTSGWEALVKGKSVLYFGYPWYLHCDGAISVRDVNSCREAFKKVQEGYKPNFQKVINYAIALERTTVKGTWQYFFDWCQVPREQTVQNLINAILKQFEKIN